MANPRFRNFCFISYTFKDTNFEKYINDHSICYFSFILHDRDIKDGGVLKEPHYHTVVRYSNPVSFQRALNDFKTLCEGTVLCEVCQDLAKSVDYLIHKNDLDKYQYPISEVSTFGNFVVKSIEGGDANAEFLYDLFVLSSIDMARKYGRDYIKNYNSYNAFKDKFQGVFDISLILEKN